MPGHPSDVPRQGGARFAEGSGSVPDRYPGNEARSVRSPGAASEDRWYRDTPSPYQAEGVFSFSGRVVRSEG